MSHLIVITGPIASGKSTVADALAACAQRAGRTAALADVDDVAFAMRVPTTPLTDWWDRARQVHAELVGAWLRSGVDVVIAHGPIFTPEETAVLDAHVTAATDVTRVLLLAPFDVALARVTGDATRGLSRDPDFLRSTHDVFSQLRPDLPPCDLEIDTSCTPLADAVAAIARHASLLQGEHDQGG